MTKICSRLPSWIQFKHMFTNQLVLLSQNTCLVRVLFRVSKGTIEQQNNTGLLKVVSVAVNRGSISKLFSYVGLCGIWKVLWLWFIKVSVLVIKIFFTFLFFLCFLSEIYLVYQLSDHVILTYSSFLTYSIHYISNTKSALGFNDNYSFCIWSFS